MARKPVRNRQRSHSIAQRAVSGSSTAVASVTERTRQIARDLGSITSYLAAGGAAAGAQELLHEIDFPAFVAGLIKGVFDAAVQGSIEQMKAYGQLVKDVARTAEQFACDDVSARQARDWLLARYPELDDDENDGDKSKGAHAPRKRKRFAQQERRRLVARAALLGIDRIVVESQVPPHPGHLARAHRRLQTRSAHARTRNPAQRK